MERVAHRIASIGLWSAGILLVVLHLLPTMRLHATTGALIPYQPWNFLSEFARTDYAPLMTACFFLLALGTLATAATFRHLRFESALLVVSGIALILLGLFPTDLADFTTDAVTCGQSTRIEPCTWVGRVHNPVSILVLLPILMVILSVCLRSRREPQWRRPARFALTCGILALGGIVGTLFYLHTLDWHGRHWNGLIQRSLVFPSLLWIIGLLRATKDIPSCTTQ